VVIAAAVALVVVQAAVVVQHIGAVAQLVPELAALVATAAEATAGVPGVAEINMQQVLCVPLKVNLAEGVAKQIISKQCVVRKRK
jgi:hypothetical protein